MIIYLREEISISWGVSLKRNNSFAAYLLIGIGIYFLLKQFEIPILINFYSWPTLLMITGIAFLIHSHTSKDYQNLFTGIIILGLGIHFHGLENYSFWIDHWAAYPFIVGIAFMIRYIKTKSGLLIGMILTGISSIMLFSITVPGWFDWIYRITDLLESFWPITIIVLGIYLLLRKK